MTARCGEEGGVDFKTRVCTTLDNSSTGSYYREEKQTSRHVFAAAALLVTMRVVQQVSHGEEGVIEDAGGNRPVLGGDQQHALQQRHKLPPVGLLCEHVAVIGSEHQVHLMDRKRSRQD